MQNKSDKSQLLQGIKDYADQIHDQLISIRRHLHMHPELSFQEYGTAQYVAKVLESHQIPFESGWGGTGLVAYIRGHNPNAKTTALRADLDALPIAEENEVGYKSIHDGVMHACGHDVHTTSLLGCILILNHFKEYLQGTVKCIFQPGEEKAPGGASILIQEGVLENPRPEFILGQHVHPTLPMGKIGVKAGKFMASADELYITVRGKGGHGAQPHTSLDPILISAHLITGLQQLVSRRNNPLTPSVLTIGKIFSKGGATNIIPEEVEMMGTFRTFDEEWRLQAHELMRKLVSGLVESMGGVVDFEIRKSYPYLYNDEALTHRMLGLMEEYMGSDNIVELPARMGAEDFSFYSHVIPACFYRLGTGFRDEQEPRMLHSPTFDIDETSLKIGSGLMAWLAIMG